MAMHILRKGFRTGELKRGSTIVEATSGNTGVSFSALGRLVGSPVVIYMPDWMSIERINLMKAYGAEVRLVSREQGGFKGSIELSEKMKKEDPENVFLPRQFDNEDNSEAHFLSTGPEIVIQLARQQRRPDAFIAGGTDSFSSLAFSGFHALHALDTDSCSPFNRSSGITLGEGSGVLIVESYEHAKARGAKIYCDVLGSGVSSDAHHITAPRPDGMGQMAAIKRAVENSALDFNDIDYINAHGTGTAKNDEAEFLSLHTLFDGSDNLSVSSTKSMTGHCLGAAGSIEAVFSVKSVCDNVIPPTIGYTAEDLDKLAEKAGKLDFVPNTKREKTVTNVMSNSFAFGGNNATRAQASCWERPARKDPTDCARSSPQPTSRLTVSRWRSSASLTASASFSF